MLKNNRGISFVGAIIVLVFLLFMFIGWVKNIVGLVKCDFEAPYKAEIVRIIGIPVAPMGCIVGYVKIEDGKKEE